MKKKKRREGHTGEANCKTIRRRRNEKERGDLKEREGGRERGLLLLLLSFFPVRFRRVGYQLSSTYTKHTRSLSLSRSSLSVQ